MAKKADSETSAAVSKPAAKRAVASKREPVDGSVEAPVSKPRARAVASKKSASEGAVELRVVDRSGKSIGTKSVSSAIFDADVPEHVLYQVVRWQRAKKRAGTHATQTRATMSGGGIKPWKQKGTGRARAGSNTSPLWVGGGIAHGPKPRSYEFQLNRKEKHSALAAVLSARTRESRLLVVEDFGLSAPKTKDAQSVLRKIGIPDREKVLVVTPAGETILTKSLRNISGVAVQGISGLNVYDVLNANYLVIVGDALKGIEERLAAA